MENSNPAHVAIILDGNRRFAKRLMLEPWKGHEYGAEKVEKLLDWLKELKIKQLTLFCLSTENLKRPKPELDYLLNVFRKEFDNISKGENKEKIEKNKIKIRFIGNLSLLPKDLQKQCKELEKQTEKNNDYLVNFCIAYGGKQELIQAIKNIIKSKVKPKRITEELIKQNLSLQDEPDLIIRTGGEKRTSNFLPWQSAYSEWFFLDKFWPEFEKEDLVQCIDEFRQRKRNFGR